MIRFFPDAVVVSFWFLVTSETWTFSSSFGWDWMVGKDDDPSINFSNRFFGIVDSKASCAGVSATMYSDFLWP